MLSWSIRFVLECPHRTSTMSSCAFCEQKSPHALATSLWGEEFREQGEDMCFGSRVDLTDLLDQAGFAHRSDLIQHEQRRSPFESNRHAGGGGRDGPWWS